MNPPSPQRRSPAKRPVQLSLRRARRPEGELEERSSPFWRWLAVIALAHVLVIVFLGWLYHAPAPIPPDQFISLLPPGELVKGAPGAPEAPKVGHPTQAHSTSSAPSPKPVTKPKPVTPPAPTPPPPQAVAPPAPVKPPTPTPTPPPPTPVVAQAEAPAVEPKPPVKPAPPKPDVHKVKVDLHLVDVPATDATDKPVKAKPHPKKPTIKPTPENETAAQDTAAAADNPGLSRADIAAKLGEKLKTAGVDEASNMGVSGSEHGKANDFSDFYDSVRDQVKNRWPCPNITDTTVVTPEVQIHVEKDGRVPPESVVLTRSSGNPTYDASALAAARSIGYTLQPLPDGCPPDISINFKLTR